jgi:hypothetical protein
MSLYALLDTTGTVVNLCSPPDGSTIAQCGFLSPAQIASAQPVPPGLAVKPGWKFVDGVFSSGVTPPVQTPVQQAQALLNKGIIINSTSGAWSDTFPVVTDSSNNNVGVMLLSEQQALDGTGGTLFLDGAAVVNWPGATGVHPLTPAQFQAFKMAIGQFVAKCRNVTNGVVGAELPATTATIP